MNTIGKEISEQIEALVSKRDSEVEIIGKLPHS